MGTSWIDVLDRGDPTCHLYNHLDHRLAGDARHHLRALAERQPLLRGRGGRVFHQARHGPSELHGRPWQAHLEAAERIGAQYGLRVPLIQDTDE